MLKEAEVQQQEMELVTIESLVPPDHLLRQIDGAVDLEFIRDRVRHLYCADNGRPALDPVVLFKLLLIGYLFGIRSERQLMREVQCNAAYRWFLRLKLTDKVPDASTLSQNRRRRFRNSDVYQQIFDEIVELACRQGLVTGKVLYTDSTHLKANANKNKFDVVRVEVRPVEYLAQLEAAVEEDRAEHGKGELSRPWPTPGRTRPGGHRPHRWSRSGGTPLPRRRYRDSRDHRPGASVFDAPPVHTVQFGAPSPSNSSL